MASSIADWLFGGKTNPQQTSNTIVQQGQPEFWLEAVKNLIAKSSAIAAEPYQAFTGQRIAQTTPDTQASYDLTRAGIGGWKPAMNTATTALSGIASGNADSVMDMIARRGQRNLTENILPEIDRTFINAGQFGSGRNEEFYGRAMRDLNQNIIDAQAGAFLQNQAQQAQAATGLAGLSTAEQQNQLRDAAALQGIGSSQEAKTQQSLDLAKQQFDEERAYPQQQAQFMSQIIRGYNPPTSTSTTMTGAANASQMAPNPLAQLAGAGAGIYGAGKAFNAFKKGGAVKGIGCYQDGGKVGAYPDEGVRALGRRSAAEDTEDFPVDVLAAGPATGRKIKMPRAEAQRLMRAAIEGYDFDKRPGYARGGAVMPGPKTPSRAAAGIRMARPRRSMAGIGGM